VNPRASTGHDDLFDKTLTVMPNDQPGKFVIEKGFQRPLGCHRILDENAEAT
jgi:hypothetical protein